MEILRRMWTQHHLYICRNDNTRQTLTESIATAKFKLARDGIPSIVYNEFIEQICLATNTANPDVRCEPHLGRIQEVINKQARMGHGIRNFPERLLTQWMDKSPKWNVDICTPRQRRQEGISKRCARTDGKRPNRRAKMKYFMVKKVKLQRKLQNERLEDY